MNISAYRIGEQSRKIKILFLCTGNSCRSQMAEGWARHLKSDLLEPWSAGIETHGMNPHAIQVMREAGVDISQQFSKNTDAVADTDFDYVITVCDNAHETCPMWLKGRAKILHAGFEDPPRLAKEIKARGGDLDEQLNAYRRVRDEIRAYIETLPQSLTGDPQAE